MSKHEHVDRGLLFSLLVRSEIRLHNAVDERLVRECGLSVSLYAVMKTVSGIEDCRVGDISAAMAISVGASSRSVDRLERDGLLQRRPNPQNRRSSLISLTEAGAERLVEASAVLDDELVVRLEGLDPAELRGLIDLLGRVLGPLESAGVGQPAG